jgi:hypothetical protein
MGNEGYSRRRTQGWLGEQQSRKVRPSERASVQWVEGAHGGREEVRLSRQKEGQRKAKEADAKVRAMLQT